MARARRRSVVVGVARRAARDDRVEERLGQLGLLVVEEQADVGELRLRPGVEVERSRRTRREPLDALADALVVEVDRILLACCTSAQAGASKRSLASALVARKSR